MTILVQSSSVFTSTLTPLVGLDVIKIERVFPLTLGSNIGTTVTGILAALAADANMRDVALQIAFCHLLFNVSGILIWYPLPFMRKVSFSSTFLVEFSHVSSLLSRFQVPIKMAKVLGETTADFRWFALFYLVFMFILAPLFVFLLSLGGSRLTIGVLSAIILTVIIIVCVNVLQRSPKLYCLLPPFLRNWEFLPEFLRSLHPWDRFFKLLFRLLMKLMCCFDCDGKSSSHRTVRTSVARQTSRV